MYIYIGEECLKHYYTCVNAYTNIFNKFEPYFILVQFSYILNIFEISSFLAHLYRTFIQFRLVFSNINYILLQYLVYSSGIIKFYKQEKWKMVFCTPT